MDAKIVRIVVCAHSWIWKMRELWVCMSTDREMWELSPVCIFGCGNVRHAICLICSRRREMWMCYCISSDAKYVLLSLSKFEKSGVFCIYYTYEISSFGCVGPSSGKNVIRVICVDRCGIAGYHADVLEVWSVTYSGSVIYPHGHVIYIHVSTSE